MFTAFLSLGLTLLFAELAAANFKRLAPVLEAWDQTKRDPAAIPLIEGVKIDPTKLLWVGGWEKLAALVWAFGTAIPLLAFAAAAHLFLEEPARSANLILGAAVGSNMIALSLAFGLILLSGPITFFRVRTMTSPVFLLLATVAFAFVCLNKRITLWEGGILLSLIVAYGFYFRRFSGEWKYYERAHAEHSLVESSEGILPVIAVFCMGAGFFLLSILVAYPLVQELSRSADASGRDPFRIGAHLVALALSLPWLLRSVWALQQSASAKALTLTSISHACLLNVLLLPGVAAFLGVNQLSSSLVAWYLPALFLYTGVFVSALLVEKETGGLLTWILILSYLVYTGFGLIL
jgi:Ca2+/Na+ antiporter